MRLLGESVTWAEFVQLLPGLMHTPASRCAQLLATPAPKGADE